MARLCQHCDKLTDEQADDVVLLSKAIAYAEQKMKWRETQRVAIAYDDGKDDVFNDKRALTDEKKEQLEQHYYEQYLKILVKSLKSEERASAKNYYKQQVYRLLRKAKANIEAAEKGYFGEGHWVTHFATTFSLSACKIQE